MKLSARNILEGTVKEVTHGAVDTEVVLELAPGIEIVSIDDFGCQHSNFDRLWQFSPDIVKLDRSLIVQATANSRARRILPKLVEIIHDLGAEAVCEGIETAEQHRLCADAGADLLQGFYYGRPCPWLNGRGDGRVMKAKSGRRISELKPVYAWVEG